MTTFPNAGRWGSDNFVNPTTGVPLPAGTQVTVVNPGGSTPAVLYSGRNRASTVLNPTSLGANGNLLFYANPGEYDLLFANGQRIPVEVHPYNQDVNSATGGTGAGVSSINTTLTGNVTGIATTTDVQNETSRAQGVENTKLSNTLLGAAGGVATLGSDGILAASQRPPSSTTTSSGGVSELSPGIPANGCYFGARVNVEPNQGSMTWAAVTAALEAKMRPQTGFKVHRHYVTPGDNFVISSSIDAALNDDAIHGRVSILSFNTPTAYTWAQMASFNGSGQLLETTAASLAKYTHNIIVMVHHECDDTTRAKGTALEYRAFASNFFTKVRAVGGTGVSTAVCFIGYKLYNGTWTTTGTSGNGTNYRDYLPADLSLLDMVATDPYNMSTTGSGTDSYQAMVSPWVSWCQTLGKPYGSFEIGIRFSASNRANWWNAAFDYVKATPTVKIMCAWHDNNGSNPYSSTGAVGDPTRDFWIDGGTNNDTESNTLRDTIKFRIAESYFNPNTTSSGGGTIDTTGLLQVSNNLSDVQSITLAQQNLRLTPPTEIFWNPGDTALLDTQVAFSIDPADTVTASGWTRTIIAASGGHPPRLRLACPSGATGNNSRFVSPILGEDSADSEIRSLWYYESGNTQMGHMHRMTTNPSTGRPWGYMVWHDVAFGSDWVMNMNTWTTSGSAPLLVQGSGSEPHNNTLTSLMARTTVLSSWQSGTSVHLKVPFDHGITVGQQLQIHLGTYDEQCVSIAVDETDVTVQSATSRNSWSLGYGWLLNVDGTPPSWVASRLEGTTLRVKAWRMDEAEPDWSDPNRAGYTTIAAGQGPPAGTIGSSCIYAGHCNILEFVDYGTVYVQNLD